MQSEELSEGKLTKVNEESGCNEKDERVLGEVKLAKNFILKELSEIIHYMDITEDNRLEADLYLERRMGIKEGT